MKLTVFTAVSKTSFIFEGILLEVGASRWTLQCALLDTETTWLIRATSPLGLPVIARRVPVPSKPHPISENGIRWLFSFLSDDRTKYFQVVFLPIQTRFTQQDFTESIIFWDITPWTPLKVNRRFGGTYRLHLQSRKISRARNQRSVYFPTLKMEAICLSETSVDFQRTARRYIPEVCTLHNHRCDNLKPYIRCGSFRLIAVQSTCYYAHV
jgi:hypothetical protein